MTSYDTWKSTNPADAYMSQDELDESELERLRTANEYAYGPAGELAKLRELLREKDAEIERLRAELKEVQEAWYGRCVIIEERDDEIERLRAENIATGRLNEQLVKSLADAAATKPAT